MVLPEKTKIWSEIKASLPYINKCGLNSVEILLWSQDKGLEEVRKRLREIKGMVEEQDKKAEDIAKNNSENSEEPDDILLNTNKEK